MREAYEVVLSAKQAEADMLRRQIADLMSREKYLQAKADNLVDRLLVRDAKVAAVAPMAIEVAKARDEETVKRLRETFEQLNDVGITPASAVKEPRAFELAGGSAVGIGN
jgi:hypothetical protein